VLTLNVQDKVLNLKGKQIGRLDPDDELIFCIRYPALDSIRSDPRYADLMRRLGLPE
jgi:hypothetical protein